MYRTFIPGVTPPPEQSETAWWFAFVGNKLRVQSCGDKTQIPYLTDLAQIGIAPVRTQFLGNLDNQRCYSAELAKDTVVPPGMVTKRLRELYGSLEEEFFAISGRAFQIVEWDRTHQYCGHCATKMVQLPGQRAKKCPNCGLANYPRLSPAVIVLVSRGEEMLLARSHRFPESLYSVVAGFVEPGESLEETVIREVQEETGILVEDIRYFGSQPWPFPNSLMIGFTAVYASGEIVIDKRELVDAAWFSKHNLPQIPPKLSIARKLIDWFLSTI